MRKKWGTMGGGARARFRWRAYGAASAMFEFGVEIGGVLKEIQQKGEAFKSTGAEQRTIELEARGTKKEIDETNLRKVIKNRRGTKTTSPEFLFSRA